jgi:hypothetical protein
MEEWKQINGYPEYEISTLGRIKGRRTQFLKLTLRDLYYEVQLGRGHLKHVHRLVAETFIPKQDGKNYVDHINRDKLDNRIENLRWATCSENLMNKDKPKNNTSGHKNINWDKEKCKWRIQIKGTTYGRFNDLDDALLNREEILSHLVI